MTTLVSISNTCDGVQLRIVTEGKTLATARVLGDELDEVWVAPPYRGRGLGRVITRLALDAAEVHRALAVSPAMSHILETMGWASQDGVHYAH